MYHAHNRTAGYCWLESMSYLEREYEMEPIGVPAFPEISGIVMDERDCSRIGIPT